MVVHGRQLAVQQAPKSHVPVFHRQHHTNRHHGSPTVADGQAQLAQRQAPQTRTPFNISNEASTTAPAPQDARRQLVQTSPLMNESDANHLKQMSKATGLMMKQIVKQPRLKGVLMQMDPTDANNRIKHLQKLLNLPNKASTVQLTCTEPALLQSSEGQVAARHRSVTQVLLDVGLEEEAEKRKTNGAAVVTQLICRAPSILAANLDYSGLVSDLMALSHQRDSGSPSRVSSSTRRPSRGPTRGPPGGSSESSSAGLDVLRLVWHRPHILAPTHVHRSKRRKNGMQGLYVEQLEAVKRILRVSQEEALDLVWKEPAVLAINPDAMQQTVDEIGRALDLSAAQLREVVSHAPELLIRSPGVTMITCRRLMDLIWKSTCYGEQLETLRQNPRNLAVAISFDTSRYDRLHYLVRTRRDPSCRLKQALGMSDADFCDMYPGYTDWWKKYGR